MATDPLDAGRISLRQDTETPLKTLNTRFGSLLYLYNRSSDSIAAETVGQDYVTFRFDAHNLTFAVCDGVGQSFIGDLAARLVGDYLVDWLWELERPDSEDSFSQSVMTALNDFTAESASQVTDYQLPDHLPPILKQALEMQRAYGSESMFVAGRVALATDEDTLGWVALCWLGDAPVAAIDIDGDLVDLGPRGSTSERWNATTGLKGTVHTWISNADNVARVAGYTDGLGLDHVPKDADLAAMVEKWINQPPIDDASLFDVRLDISPETVSEFERPKAASQPIKRAKQSETEPIEREPIILGDGSEPTYQSDEARPLPQPDPNQPATRPIKTDDEPKRTPVANLEPLQKKDPDQPITGEWRPLSEQKSSAPKPDKDIDKPLDDVRASLAKLTQNATSLDPKQLTEVFAKLNIQDPSKKQQVDMWQQAALLGLTSAALALLMVERLLDND